MLTPERLAEIEKACRKSPFLFKRDWLGERVIPEGVIYVDMISGERHEGHLSVMSDSALILKETKA